MPLVGCVYGHIAPAWKVQPRLNGGRSCFQFKVPGHFTHNCPQGGANQPRSVPTANQFNNVGANVSILEKIPKLLYYPLYVKCKN